VLHESLKVERLVVAKQPTKNAVKQGIQQQSIQFESLVYWFYQGLPRYFISQPLGSHFSQVLNSISAPAMELSIQALPASTFWRL